MQSLRVILVDPSSTRSAILEQALRDAGLQVIGRFAECDMLVDRISELQPDIVLVDIESPDRDTLESLQTVGRDNPRPIVVFAEDDSPDAIAAAVRAGVSAYVVDGLQPHRVRPIVEVAIARFREFQALRRELEATRSQLAERKLNDKAKGLLMEHRNQTEAEAYASLRKLAMDRNQRIAEVARNVIDVFELLG